MAGEVCTRARVVSVLLAAVVLVPAVAAAQSAFKIAYWNVQSGKGEPPLPGRIASFADVPNCTDPAQPMNAWGTGFFQEQLVKSIKADPQVIALGLGESWPSVCGSPENIRQVLGWKSRTSSNNGVAMVAKYGFVGGEEWLQLDTTQNTNPADTMWVLRMNVCLDEACSATINVFAAHWYGSGTNKRAVYDRQGQQTADFLTRAGGSAPHVLVGDLNAWDGTVKACGQNPVNAGLQPLRNAGYVDAWLLLHGSAEGFTGMTNRAGCGVPEGYAWKRPDYTWAPANFLPLSITRFGVVPAGDAAPSDHYGLIAEFPMPGGSTAPLPPAPLPQPPLAPTPLPPPSGTPTPSGEIVLHAANATNVTGNWQLVPDAEAAGGARMWNPDKAAAKVGTAAIAPADYFELTFNAEAGRGYRLWIRGRAERDYWGNDSAHVQFDGSVSQAGAPIFRIGTSSATWVGVEDCSGCAIRAWGWNDNAYGANATGALIYFAASGPQTLRVQRREDGLSIDQIVLSPLVYLTNAPGAGTNDVTILAATGIAAPAQSSPAIDIVVTAADVTATAGSWQVTADSTAAGGSAVWNPDAGASKVLAASAAPAQYVDLTFYAEAGRAYRLWLRGRADRDSWANDSVFVQFSGSTNAAGAAVARIGTTDAFIVNLEDGANAGLAGWGWQDNGYGPGVLGPLVTFATTGSQTIRVQTREDGIRVDQIVLSSQLYLTSAPGALKNDATILR